MQRVRIEHLVARGSTMPPVLLTTDWRPVAH